MSNTIKLTIISDVVCPWCVIGYKRVQQAIDELGIAELVSIEWEPYELNEYMPEKGEDAREHIAKKYGMTHEDVLSSNESMTKLGAEFGFTFDYSEGLRVRNTFKAHILLEYAKKLGKQTELKLQLFEAFFTHQKDVSDEQVLRDILVKSGLDADTALASINDPLLAKVVKERELFWRNNGVNSVPTMVYNDQSATKGAQSVESYKQILKALISGEVPTPFG
ncbi:MAG: DsbA family oxidoreductase [Desulfovibrio sp.]